MLKYLLFIAFLSLSSIISAQEWTDPINISHIAGTDRYPDVTIAKDGTFHCVWVHQYSNYFGKIFYSYSTDEGITWSTPQDISQNDTLSVSYPHIVANSENNLFVAYQYDAYSPIVVIQTFDGNSWSKIDSIAEGYSGGSRIFIDNNDRVYVYWSTGSDNMYYRYYEYGSWSEVYCPFNSTAPNWIVEGFVDSEDNLHFIGVYDGYVAYYKYDKDGEQMESPYILTYNNAYKGGDITVDESNNPHIVWSDSQYYDHGTMYIRKSGEFWGTHTFIADSSYLPKIIYCNNKPYIMDVEELSKDSLITVFHQKDDYGIWYGQYIFSSNGLWLEKLFSGNKKLIALYSLMYDNEQFDTYLIKTKTGVGINGIESINKILTLHQNFPNPLSNNTTITYQLNKKGRCILNIYNIEGKILQTLVNKNQLPGNYTVEWNGIDNNGNKLLPGIYLYRLKS